MKEIYVVRQRTNDIGDAVGFYAFNTIEEAEVFIKRNADLIKCCDCFLDYISVPFMDREEEKKWREDIITDYMLEE